jgi:hypothetical protein
MLPYFSLSDLVNFSQVNKECNQLMDPKSKMHRINYKVLFGEQGIELTANEVAET